jgi:hypothetical protein
LYKLGPNHALHNKEKRPRWESHFSHIERGVLELKGHPYPSLRPKPRNNRQFLTNVLLEAARKDFEQKQDKGHAE